MPIPYEILIRGENGVFKGAHVIDVPGGIARAIKPGDWPDIAASVNITTLARINELETQHEEKEKELSEVKAIVSDATAVILDPDISDEDTVKALKASIEAQTLPGRIAVAEAELASAKAKLAALTQNNETSIRGAA